LIAAGWRASGFVRIARRLDRKRTAAETACSGAR
jgi:hypothetical protein